MLGVYHRFEKAILSLGLMALFLVGHSILNDLASQRPQRYLPELVEGHIPFVPVFIVIYLSAFALLFVPAIVIGDRIAFRRTACGFLVVILVSFAIFYALPLTVQRIEQPPGNGVFVRMVGWFQSIAKPHNTFPSLHMALCTLAAFSCLAYARRVGVLMTVYAALVALSTLFLKLHNVLDVIAGLVLASAVSLWLLKRVRSPK